MDLIPSSFVTECLATMKLPSAATAIDIPCGYGRHSVLLASLGYEVFCADYDFEALSNIRSGYGKRMHPIHLDAKKDLPFKDGSLGVAVVVHFTYPRLISRLTKLLLPGGYLIYETFGGQGENWRSLPVKGEIASELKNSSNIIKYNEHHVGPVQHQKVSVKLFAIRR